MTKEAMENLITPEEEIELYKKLATPEERELLKGISYEDRPTVKLKLTKHPFKEHTTLLERIDGKLDNLIGLISEIAETLKVMTNDD